MEILVFLIDECIKDKGEVSHLPLIFFLRI